MPKVTVIVPVYKVEHCIEKCLHSLFMQTLEDIEYIFIDDCSPDKSLTILNSIIELYPNRKENIRIISLASNSGTGKVRNIGIKEAKGEYIIHCDSDDWVDENYYEELYATAIAEDADIVVADFIREYSNSSIKIVCNPTDNPKRTLHLMPNDSFYCMLWNKLIRRKLLVDNSINTMSGMDMWEDVYVTVQSYYFANRVSKAQGVYYHYCLNQNSYTANSANEKSFNQRKMCIDGLKDFFANKEDDWSEFIDFWKLLSKSYLLSPNSYNPWRWRAEYSDAMDRIHLIKGFSQQEVRHMKLADSYPIIAVLYALPNLILANIKRCAKSFIKM